MQRSWSSAFLILSISGWAFYFWCWFFFGGGPSMGAKTKTKHLTVPSNWKLGVSSQAKVFTNLMCLMSVFPCGQSFPMYKSESHPFVRVSLLHQLKYLEKLYKVSLLIFPQITTNAQLEYHVSLYSFAKRPTRLWKHS